MLAPASRRLSLIGCIALVLACGSEETAPPKPDPGPASPAAAPAAEDATPVSARAPGERPLPAFSGTTFAGDRVSVSEFLGRRFVLFFFNPAEAEAEPAIRAMTALAPLQGKHNFRILGIATGASTTAARTFLAENPLDFTVLNDASGALARQFGIRIPAGLLFADAEGYVTGGMGGVAEDVEDPAATLEAKAREELRLPTATTASLEPGLGEYPRVPDLTGGTLSGDTFRLSDLAGRPVILAFFLYTCPHCHHALEFLRDHLKDIPESARPALVGVSVSGTPSAVRSQLREMELDFFPVVIDPDGTLRKQFGVTGGVPDILLLDSEHRVRARTQGWRDDIDPALMRMRLARIAGQPVPMLLHQSGYSGNEFCGVCHESQADTWRFTKHAQAYDTLVRHGAERDAECVGCHVVGFGKPGGFEIAAPSPWLEDVGCEDCHGRGGPHLSPDFVQGGNYQPVCVTCHDTKHSLGFEYSTFLPKVSHAANAYLLALSPDEKQARLAALGSTRKALFPDAPYVGSDACQPCHAQEFATWEPGPHGSAIRSLAADGKASDAECQVCHTTGPDKPGGFPLGSDPSAHPDLARVGCESCHGPGGNHVGADARKDGTIVSLTDKCDSCVILQICGGCHDDANDPGFEFHVEEKIEAQRHGTIQPSIERQPEARLEHLGERIGAIERAFAAGGR